MKLRMLLLLSLALTGFACGGGSESSSTTATDETYTTADVNPIPGGSMSDLNNLTDSAGEPVVKNPNFGRAIAYQRPRTFRFGLRFEF